MTAPGASRAEPARRELPSRDADSGLITLEWLLIVGAIAGLAATSVLAVQRVLDDTSEAPTDPLVRLLQADVAAAFVAAEAQSTFDDNPTGYSINVNSSFRGGCFNIPRDFDDVVANSSWFPPNPGRDGTLGTPDDEPARCDVTPLPNLGG